MSVRALILLLVDGDIFGAVGRLGRDTAEALLAAVRGGQPLDPFLPTRCLELMFNAAGGVPSLDRVFGCFAALADAPLLTPVLRDGAFAQVECAVHDAKGTVLDRILLTSADRQLEARAFDPAALAENYALDILDRAIVSPRGGVMDLAGGDRDARGRARELLRPIAREVADVLLRHPDVQRLGLSGKYKIEDDTDLLGGGGGEST